MITLGKKIKCIIPIAVMILCTSMIGGRIYVSMAGGNREESQVTEEMDSFMQANSATYPSLGMGSFNTYAIFRVYGSNDAAYSSDLFNSITADSGVIKEYYPYIMNTEIVDGKEVNTYIYDADGNKAKSEKPWHYIGSIIPDDYYQLFDIAIEDNGQVTFTQKKFNACTNSGYKGGRYIAFDNAAGKVISEDLNSTTKKKICYNLPAMQL